MTGRYTIKTPPQHGTWREFLDVWLAADQIDVFESAWTMDHFYPLTPPMDGTHLESWTMLAALAQATTRLRLGAMVNGMHYRHPAVTANMAVTVDHISNGRFVLGLGAGWFEQRVGRIRHPARFVEGPLRPSRRGSAGDPLVARQRAHHVLGPLLRADRGAVRAQAGAAPPPDRDRRQGQAPHAPDRRSVRRPVGRDVPARRRVLARPRRDDAFVLRRDRTRRDRDHTLDPPAVRRATTIRSSWPPTRSRSSRRAWTS